jgi:hypothetical protein
MNRNPGLKEREDEREDEGDGMVVMATESGEMSVKAHSMGQATNK